MESTDIQLPDITRIFHNLREGVVVFDTDQKILQANIAAKRLAGKKTLQLMGGPMDCLFGRQTGMRIAETIDRLMQNADIKSEPFVVEAQNKTLEISVICFHRDEIFNFGAGLILLYDLTSHMNTQRQLARKIRQLDYYSDIMSHLGDGIMVLDRNRNILFSNRFFLDFFDISGCSTVGRKCRDLLACQNGSSCLACEAGFDNLFAAGKKYSFERVLRNRDGVDHHFIVSGAPLDVTPDGISSALFSFNDVTELRRLTGCIEASAQIASLLIREKNFRKKIPEILEIAGNAYHARQVLWYENQSLEDGAAMAFPLSRWISKESRNGKEKTGSLLKQIMADDIFRRWFDVLSEGQSVHELTSALPENERSFFEHRNIRSVLAIPVLAQERLEGFLLLADCAYDEKWREMEVNVLQMTTDSIANAIENQKASAEKEELRKQLIKSQRMECMGEISSGVAHNFRNILAGIIANSQLILMKDQYDKELETLVEGIKKLSFEGSELIDNLLRFSREGEVFEQKVFNLAATLCEVYKIVAHSFDKKIQIRKKWPEAIHIKGNPSMLYQVFMNLCTNARDAMPDGGVLDIEARREGDRIIVVISDTGIGMDEVTCEKIFTPFFTTKAEGKGTGLGLSTAYGIVMDHGGNIETYSQPGLGTTFRISFPARQAERLPDKKFDNLSVRGQGQKILIVDDDESFNKVTNKLLNLMGFSTFSALSGYEATEIYKAVAPNLVLLDRNMDGMDGVETAEILFEFDPDAKIVFLSGYDKEGPDGIPPDLADRIRGYISKPFEIDELSAAMAEIFGEKGGESIRGGTRAE